MRGKPEECLKIAAAQGNIPAYAGKTSDHSKAFSCAKEHPRVCGENLNCSNCMMIFPGTSPRMRGKLFRLPRQGCAGGNIPAYAGKTRWSPTGNRIAQEHPRVCGENHIWGPKLFRGPGTSPRMRGKLRRRLRCCWLRRNIPAYAGKTR